MTIKSTQVQTVPPIEAIFYRNFQASHIPEIMEEIWLKKIYDPFLLGKKDLTIVDGGQHIGLFSYYAKDCAKRVIGIEPSKSHNEECRKMLEFNKITNVEILPYALSNKAEKKKFYTQDFNNTAYSLTAFQANQPFEEVESITIDDLFKLGKIDGKIDFFKADFEGEEAKIFMSDSFKKNKERIPVIAGEWHDWNGTNPGQFMNMFRDMGYEFNYLPNMKATVFTAVLL